MNRPLPLVALMCLAQVLSMAGFATYATVLPELQLSWGLSNTQAGWIASAFFVGYVVAVPPLVGLTDHNDPRRIWLAGALFAGLGNAGFAWLASDLWSATAFQALAGAGLAGTYMPGLKMLTDRLPHEIAVRATPYYTATFGIGTALSYWLATHASDWSDWRAAFTVAAAGTLLAAVLVLLSIPPRAATTGGSRHPLNFLPVLRNPAILTWSLAYAGHSWELLALRAWLVALLGFNLARQGTDPGAWDPGNVATLVALGGVPASVLGAEIARLMGRRRTIRVVMAISLLLAVALGAAAGGSYRWLAGLALVYNVFILADSGAITAGVIHSTPADLRGAAMAVHSILGFSAGIVGPLAVGLALDLAGGGDSVFAWLLGVITIGLGSILGLLALSAGRQPGERI
ncbi:MAG: MFS transporter [Gammaproteobacteria bacterium]|nr:MFS transporter [Gammaproteobacteria bacterium]